MQLTKGAIGNLINRYKAVLKKCHLMNTFGSLAVAGMLIMGGAGMAVAADDWGTAAKPNTTGYTWKGEDPVTYKGDVYIKTGTNRAFQAYQDGPDENNKDYKPTHTSEKGTISLGSDSSTIVINSSIEKKSSYGVMVFDASSAPHSEQLKLNLTGDTISISAESKDGYAGALHVGSDVTKSYIMTNNTVNIVSKNGTTIYAKGTTGASAIEAMSGGILNISGPLTAKAELKDGSKGDVIYARGQATVNIGANGETVKLDGNINFGYEGTTSGTGVDAPVTITLTGKDSHWNGNTYVSWDDKADKCNPNGHLTDESKLVVHGLSLTLKNDAVWTPNQINEKTEKYKREDNKDYFYGQQYTALNELRLDGGIVDVNEGVAITIENINGKGAITNAGSVTIKKGSIEGPITFEKGAAKADNMVTVGKDRITTLTGGVAGSGTIDKLAIEDSKTTITNAKLSGHEGRALWNEGTLTVDGGSFEGNQAGKIGGAIYNTKTGGGEGSITFTGTNTFTNNTAAGKANDIYNAGTITVAGGTTTLNSGLVLAAGSQTKVSGGALVINGTTTWEKGENLGSLTVNGGALTLQKGDVLVGYDTTKEGTSLSVTGGSLYLITTEDYTLNDLQKAKEKLSIANEGMSLGFQGGKLVDDQNSGNLTVAATEDGKVIGTSNITIGDAPVSTGGNTVLVENDLTIKADGNSAVTITGNADVKVNSVDIRADAAASVVIQGGTGTGSLTTGSLTVVGNGAGDKLVTSNGNALADITVENGGTFTMGIEGNSQAQGGQVGTVTVTDGGTLTSQGNAADTSEYAINALTMHDNSKVNVLNSTMQIGEFQANGGTMFVDPAYVKIGSVTSPTSRFGTQLLVGSGSTVDIGGMPEADMRQAMEEAGMSVGPNFTVGANQSVLVLGQALTLDTDGQIVVDADVNSDGTIGSSSTPVTNTVHFGDDSLLVVDAGKLDGLAAIDGSVTTGKTAFIADGAKLQIVNATKGDVTILKGFTGTSGTTSGTTSGINIGTGWGNTTSVANPDRMLSSTLNVNRTAGSVTVTSGVNRASDVLPGLDSDLDPVMASVWDNSLNDVDSADMGVRFLSRAANSGYIADAGKAAATIESAARIAFAGAVPQMTKMASDAATNAVVNRLGFANPADGAQAMDAEGKIVDRNTTGFALWIAPLWQNQHGWGMEAGNMDYGFNGNLGGVSLGADYTFENAIRAGITFNIGGGYAESSGGDLSSTDNRMNFWGLGAYAGWNYENFGLMADVSYTSTWNQLKQDLDSRLGMGNELEADVQATAISAGLRAEYLLQTSALDIIPHIGVRYMSLNTWGYDVEANGGNVLEGDGFHQDIWTFPVGVTFTKDFTLDSGWSFKPSIDFSVIPAAGDIKAKQDVRFTGAPVGAELETQMMDYLTWQGGVGLELANDNMSIGVNYTLQAGQHTTGHGVFGSFRYEF